MKLIYDFLFFLIDKLTFVLGFFSIKIRSWNLAQQEIFTQTFPKKNTKRVWAHCASLGEYELIRPILEQYKAKNWEIVVSFFSASGYDKRKHDPLLNFVTYLPLDRPKRMQKFVDLIDADVFLLIKYEFWLNLLDFLHQKKTKMFLIGAVFYPKQFFFYPVIGKYFRKFLTYFDQIFIQDEQSVNYAKQWQLKNIIKTADPRIDRVLQNISHKKTDLILENFKKTSNFPLLILGSSWEKEEELILRYLQKNPSYKVIIAPHEVNEKHLKFLLKKINKISYFLYSKITAQADFNTAQILIIDQIGILANSYQYGDLAFIGGGFKGKGIHNILEATVFGLPVLVGPKIHKNPEVQQFIEKNIAFIVKNIENLTIILEKFKDKNLLKNLQHQIQQEILLQKGVSVKIFEQIQ